MLRIYHTSDLHDHRGIAQRLHELRSAQPGLLVDCGDSLRGSQTVYYRREPIIAEIDAAGYDVQAMGNREFHYLFAAVRARASKMRHPLICSNLTDLKRRPLPYRTSLAIERDGARVHFLGLLVPQYRPGSPWERIFGWRFEDPAATVRAYAERIPAGDALIVLSHLGLRSDRRLAGEMPRIDLLLGGHSHDTLATPEYAGSVPIVHAGPYGKHVSKTLLEHRQGRWHIADFALEPLLS
jgi:5'-nucleotidase